MLNKIFSHEWGKLGPLTCSVDYRKLAKGKALWLGWSKWACFPLHRWSNAVSQPQEMHVCLHRSALFTGQTFQRRLNGSSNAQNPKIFNIPSPTSQSDVKQNILQSGRTKKSVYLFKMKSTKTMIIYEIMKPKSWFDLVCNHVNITDFSTTKKQTKKSSQ